MKKVSDTLFSSDLSAAMYSRDEEYIMLAYSVGKCVIDII
jgi:hypothetical protein